MHSCMQGKNTHLYFLDDDDGSTPSFEDTTIPAVSINTNQTHFAHVFAP